MGILDVVTQERNIESAVNRAQIAHRLISDSDFRNKVFNIYNGWAGQKYHGTGMKVIENNQDVYRVLFNQDIRDAAIEIMKQNPGEFPYINDVIANLTDKSAQEAVPDLGNKTVSLKSVDMAIPKYVAIAVPTANFEDIKPEDQDIGEIPTGAFDDIDNPEFKVETTDVTGGNDGYYVSEIPEDFEDFEDLADPIIITTESSNTGDIEETGEPEDFEDFEDFDTGDIVKPITMEELNQTPAQVETPSVVETPLETPEIPVETPVQAEIPQVEPVVPPVVETPPTAPVTPVTQENPVQQVPQAAEPPKKVDAAGEANDAISTLDSIKDQKALKDLSEDESIMESIDLQVTEVLNTFDELYKSGYGGASFPCGILTNFGVIKGYADGNIGIDKSALKKNIANMNMYVNIMQALNKSSGFKPFVELTGASPAEIRGHNVMGDNSDPKQFVFYNTHLRAMFGHFKYNKGLRKMADENPNEGLIIKPDGTKSGRVKTYKLLRKYLRKELRYIYLDEYIRRGYTSDMLNNPAMTQQINVINARITQALKNIVAVAEDNKNIYGEIRISSSQPIRPEEFIENFNRISNGYMARLIAYNAKLGLLKIRVVFDLAKESDTKMFAHEALDNITESGQVPAWDHALLGKDRDGNPFFWDDFVSDTVSKKAYCLYAASRAGKGIMTSTIITNILANGLPLFYMDAKPENGAGLAKIAWSKGLEAPVFNGPHKGATPYQLNLEEYSDFNGKKIRPESLIYSSHDKIPDGIFKHSDDKKAFMRVITYFRGIELFMNMIMMRQSMSIDPRTNSMIFIFDEMFFVANEEAKVHDIFRTYLDSKGAKIDLNWKISYNEKSQAVGDVGVRFIERFYAWIKGMLSTENTAVAISLGKAAMNVFFIFQGSSWMNNDYSNTFTSKFLLKLDSTKIVGRQGISGNGGDGKYGDGVAASYKWVKYINSDANAGHWAITHSASVRDCADKSDSDEAPVTIFKPFSLFLEPDPTRPAPPEPEVFLEGYLNKLFGSLGIQSSPAQVLDNAYKTFNKAVIDLGLAPSLNDFMYNAHDFTDKTMDVADYSGRTVVAEGNPVQNTNQMVNGARMVDTSAYEIPTQPEAAPTPQNPVAGPSITGFSYPEAKLPMGDPAVAAALGVENPSNIDSGEILDFGVAEPTVATGGQSNDPFANLFRQTMQGEIDRYNQPKTEGQGQSQQQPSQNPTVSFVGDDLEEDYIESGIFNEQPDNTFGDQSGFQGFQGQQNNVPFGGVSPQPEIPIARAESRIQSTPMGEYRVNTSGVAAEQVRLDSNNSIPLDNTVEFKPTRFRFKLFESESGANWDMKKRWKFLLKSINKVQNRNTITKIVLRNDSIMFNNKIVVSSGVYGGPDGVTVSDIVDFVELGQYFPNLKTLHLDVQCYTAMVYSCGSDISKWFNLFPKLTTLLIQKPDGSVVGCNRSEPYSINAMQSENARTTLRQQIDAISNSNATGGTGIDNWRAVRGMRTLTGAGWTKCKQNFRSKKPLKGALYGGLVIAGATLSAGIGAISGIGKSFSRK